MYNEILELYEFCKEQGIPCRLSSLFDGYKLWLFAGRDIVQHFGSYGSREGCVEPAIGCDADFTAVSLDRAKALLLQLKDILTKGEEV